MEIFERRSTLHSNKHIFTCSGNISKFLLRLVLSWRKLRIKKRYCNDTWCWGRCQCCNLEQLSIRYFLFPERILNKFQPLMCLLGLDYDSFTTPELHFLFFRIIHGLIIVFFVRDFMKSAMKKVLSKIHGPITDKNIKDRGIEVPLKFSIYSAIGFTVSFIIPAVNAQLGLYR